MGYVALITGYLKRVSLGRWLAYVTGAVFLGYLFNFLRLCLLVLYYRVALGHAALEHSAKTADYVIGSCLFLVATWLFIWLVRRKQPAAAPQPIAPDPVAPSSTVRAISLKCAAFAVALLAVLALPSSALKYSHQVPAAPQTFAGRMPKQVGDFVLTRTWHEQQGSTTVTENGAYSAAGSDEVVLGVWVGPLTHFHDPTRCWLARGLQPAVLTTEPFTTASGEASALSTGYYNDGITDSILINALCTPTSCSQFPHLGSSGHIGILYVEPQKDELSAPGRHLVSIMIRIDRLHSTASSSVNYGLLSAEARRFLSGLDMKSLSRAFQ